MAWSDESYEYVLLTWGSDGTILHYALAAIKLEDFLNLAVGKILQGFPFMLLDMYR